MLKRAVLRVAFSKNARKYKRPSILFFIAIFFIIFVYYSFTSNEFWIFQQAIISANVHQDFQALNPETKNVIIVFGASGDLAKRSIYPALWKLFNKKFLKGNTFVVGFARSDLTIETIRKNSKLDKVIDNNKRDRFESFWRHNFFHKGLYGSANDYKSLNNAINIAVKHSKTNRLFYLAIPPKFFEVVTYNIHKYCLSKNGWNRVIIEKPFGKDLESAKTLNNHLRSLFNEDQLYRMDHYLGKEILQNIIPLRFDNKYFSKTWNRDYVSSVEILFKEPFGVRGRGGYFDEYGIIRDVVQNHLMQLVTLIAMDKPTSSSESDIHDEKIKLLKSISPIAIEDTVVGQYIGNKNGIGEAKLGYRDDPSVSSNSSTPTFALCIVKIFNERWNGVPFILNSGKAMNEHRVEVIIKYKNTKSMKIRKFFIRLEPQEAVCIKKISPQINSKISCNETHSVVTMSDAYERLIPKVFLGDKSNFVKSDELMESWRIFTPLLKSLKREKVNPIFYFYGDKSLKEADNLIHKYESQNAVHK